ncbi:disintegrin and metalloproteinase domain-containing protein 17 [Platysternon megacephalum]|uniref:Disintegrin and metalloproteinase domain-containing protein 17 n=1 Tax=Platysternon megacephalum TaxID=55544 RepID=A0A4D9ESU8_9SAUR|nr:disintegrin and metalloproteinase domain-containing protein 17 [Platysternon megacephalum]
MISQQRGYGVSCWEDGCTPVGRAVVALLVQGQRTAALESRGVVRDAGAVCCMYCLEYADKAPLSKSLLLVPSALSVLLTLLFQHYQKFFTYNLQAVKEDFQIWRLVFGRTVCLDLKDTFCSSLLIYNFRIFERRYGSRKFSSFLLGSWMLSALFDLLLVEVVQYAFGITISSLPSGL